MRQVLFSAGGVLFSICICSILVFNPLIIKAQTQIQQPKVAPLPQKQAPPHPQQQAPPVKPKEELKDIAPTEPAEPIRPQTATPGSVFEEIHKDKRAIFLLYETTVTINEDFSYTTKVHKKAKILKEEARFMGEIPIPYTKGVEKVVDIKAYTTTPDGKRHRYSKIQDIRMHEGNGMYSDERVKIITLPQVNPGSVLEYEVTVITKQKPIKGAFWHYLDLNFGIPAKKLHLAVTFPKTLNIAYKEFNLDYKPEITETDSTITYSWHLENLYYKPETEDYLPPPTLDSCPNVVEFSSLKSWADISDWYYALIQKNLKITPNIERCAKELAKPHQALKDRVRAVLEYIQDNFRYVSMSFGENALEPHPTDEVFRHKYGDCKDTSLLCMALLKACGIDSCIAFFSDEYSITAPQHDLPMPGLFNHVILLVKDPEGGDFYIDPLLKGYDIGQYHPTYQNAYTFVITEDGGRFDRLPIFDEKRDYKKSKWIATISQDGSASIETEAHWDLTFSIRTRDMFNAMNKEQEKRFLQMLKASIVSGGEMLNYRIEGLDREYGPLTSYSKYQKPDLYPITDDMIIINIQGFKRGSEFTEKERNDPIFCPANALREKASIYRIPEGFYISHIPENITLDIGFFSIERRFKKNKNEVMVTEIQRHRRLELPKEDYKKVKDFFDQLPAKTTQRIVLKRIKPWWHKLRDLWYNIKGK